MRNPRLPIGYFGASTGAAAALWAAADPEVTVNAVVSRGGRPDLAIPRLAQVRAPTLLIVGGDDDIVIELNREAAAPLRCEHRIEIVPGATHLFEEPGTLERRRGPRCKLVHQLPPAAGTTRCMTATAAGLADDVGSGLPPLGRMADGTDADVVETRRAASQNDTTWRLWAAVLFAGIGLWTYGLLVARPGFAPGGELVVGAVFDQVVGLVSVCIGATGLAVVFARHVRAQPTAPPARETAASGETRIGS